MRLKDYFDKAYAERLAKKISQYDPRLDKDRFVSDVNANVAGKEYTQRLLGIVEVFDRHLQEYPKTLHLFESLLGPRLSSFANIYEEGIWLAPIGKYVEVHGSSYPQYFDLSVHFIEELTQRYTGEFAMRPLIQAFPKKSFQILKQWSQSSDPYVRRLASECMRIRLPWAKKMTVALEQFDAFVEILTHLRSDENTYVRRSVANNLNDLYKYDRSKAQFIVDYWLKNAPSLETLQIIHHGTRSLRKRTRK